MIDLNDDTIKAILDTAEKFAQRELIDSAHEHDNYPYTGFAKDAFNKAWEAGLVFITAPEDLGGVDLPAGIWALVLEKVALSDSGFAASLLAHAMAAEAILKWGKDELKAEWIGTDPLKLLGYPAYLQADDPQGLPAARKEGDGYLLTGVARLVANAPVADATVVAADIDDGDPGLFLVPLDEETRPEPVDMLGLRSCPVGHIDFEDLQLPGQSLLATGEKAIAELHGMFYPSVTAILIAAHKASLDYAVEYGMERYQGGRMIHEHSQLRSMYGMMAAENLTLRQAWLKGLENGADNMEKLSVKIMAADLAIRGVMDGVQLLGGYGYTMEYPQERRMRDARQAAELLGSPIRQKLAIIDEMIGTSDS